MKSPFWGRQNAVLTFEIPTEEMAASVRGNVLPTGQKFPVKCYLKTDSRPQSVFYPGIQIGEEPLVGYAVDPMYLPASIKDGAIAKAEIGVYQGIFILGRSLLPVPEAEAAAGTKIRGVFKRQV